jgi:hypothetical protein
MAGNRGFLYNLLKCRYISREWFDPGFRTPESDMMRKGSVGPEEEAGVDKIN